MRAPGPTLPSLHTARYLAIIFGCLALFGASAAAPSQTPATTLRISAAGELAPAMPALAQTYERQTGTKVIVVTGPSEKQVARIEHGEIVDLFLGSDFTYPEKLVADGLTDAKAPVAYAKGTLVLFARKDSTLQPLNLERLEDNRLQKLAIPDPLQAPLGRAAIAALRKLKLVDRLTPKFVVSGDSVEGAQQVESGVAQIGFLSLTVARSDHYRTVGTFVEVPQSQYPEIRDYAVVLRGGKSAEAHRFLDWLLSTDIQAKLPGIGLDAVR